MKTLREESRYILVLYNDNLIPHREVCCMEINIIHIQKSYTILQYFL